MSLWRNKLHGWRGSRSVGSSHIPVVLKAYWLECFNGQNISGKRPQAELAYRQPTGVTETCFKWMCKLGRQFREDDEISRLVFHSVLKNVCLWHGSQIFMINLPSSRIWLVTQPTSLLAWWEWVMYLLTNKACIPASDCIHSKRYGYHIRMRTEKQASPKEMTRHVSLDSMRCVFDLVHRFSWPPYAVCSWALDSIRKASRPVGRVMSPYITHTC